MGALTRDESEPVGEQIAGEASSPSGLPSGSPSGLPAAERLVNLTPHEIVVRAAERSVSPGETDRVRLPPSGRFARVDDDAARLGSQRLAAGAAPVELTRLRRSAALKDLPPPLPGTRFVVSRLTALAARDRADLVFPFGEERDEAGRITGVSGLAAFRLRRGLVREPGRWVENLRAGARDRRSRQPLPREWVTAVLFAAATALLSGFLALLPGAIDNATAHGWAGNGQAVTSWSGIGFLLVGAALLVAGAWRWRTRVQMLTERGTAYVIDEVAEQFQHEDKDRVLAKIRAGFARTLLVPGPAALGGGWQWRADADGAGRWDERVDELVRAFWAVHFNDDQVTRNALYTWAPWPVAMAFGARATAGHRGLVLNVRQRPSFGAAGPRKELRLSDEPHDFLRGRPPASLADVSKGHQVTCLRERVMLTLEPLSEKDSEKGGARRPGSPAARPVPRRRVPAGRWPAGRGPAGTPLLLLVRVTHGPIDVIGMDLAATPTVAVWVCDDLLGVGGPGESGLVARVAEVDVAKVEVAEWRLTSASGPVPPLPWEAFPAAAEQIADWIIEQAGGDRDRVVLLATRIPQELGVGLGIQLSLRAGDWPKRLYPAYYDGSGLVVPRLRLGADSVPAERPARA